VLVTQIIGDTTGKKTFGSAGHQWRMEQGLDDMAPRVSVTLLLLLLLKFRWIFVPLQCSIINDAGRIDMSNRRFVQQRAWFW
jgi:hypothetical protein